LQFTNNIIEGGQFFAFFGGTGRDNNFFALGSFYKHIIVKSVEGFADFKHGVIGCINEVADYCGEAIAAQPWDALIERGNPGEDAGRCIRFQGCSR